MLTDLHNHLLWDLDDGPATPEASLEMARGLARLGFGVLAPSPHCSSPPEEARRRLESCAALLERGGLTFELHPNAENRITPEALEAIFAGRGRMLGGTRAVLLELPFLTPLPPLSRILARLRAEGFLPILAHPERSAHFQVFADAESLVGPEGALLQLDVGSLVGRYGRESERLARQLLASGLYALAATDLHAPEDLDWLEPALRELERLAGGAGYARLLDENPTRLLKGVWPR